MKSKSHLVNQQSQENPCTSCGACCSYFRVEFYWRETEKNSEYQVPEHLTEDLNPFKKCMRGTLEKSGNRCVALSGKVGKQVACTNYKNRPTPCRNFQASYADGKTPNRRCDEARAAKGLAPIPRPASLQKGSEKNSHSNSIHPQLLERSIYEIYPTPENTLDAGDPHL